MPNALTQALRRLNAPRLIRRRVSRLTQVDCLEVRTLPTAIVTFTGAALTIKGDTGSNDITVERIGTQLHVDANGGTINVLGTDVPEFFFNLAGSFNLTATFQGSPDALAISGGLQLRSANINMGDGGNAIALADVSLSGKLTIVAGDDGNAIAMTQVSVTGNTLVDTGELGDAIAITSSTFTGSTTIKTDGGGDAIGISGGLSSRTKFVGKLTISTGNDGDALAMTKIESKAISIDMGSDSAGDALALADFLVGGPLSVKTGAGGDAVAVSGIIQSAGASLFDLGSESDAMAMSQCSFSGATTINLGTGAPGNALNINDVSFNSSFTLNSQGADAIAIETSIALLGATTFAKAARFNLGAGTLMTISTPNAATKTNFLSTVSFSSPLPGSTVTVDPVNTSFARTPKLKNVVLV